MNILHNVPCVYWIFQQYLSIKTKPIKPSHYFRRLIREESRIFTLVFFISSHDISSLNKVFFFCEKKKKTSSFYYFFANLALNTLRCNQPSTHKAFQGRCKSMKTISNLNYCIQSKNIQNEWSCDGLQHRFSQGLERIWRNNLSFEVCII